MKIRLFIVFFTVAFISCGQLKEESINNIIFPKNLVHLSELKSAYLLGYLNGDCYSCVKQIDEISNYFEIDEHYDFPKKIIVFYTSDSIYFSSVILPQLNIDRSNFSIYIDKDKYLGKLNNLNTSGYNYFYILEKTEIICNEMDFNALISRYNHQF